MADSELDELSARITALEKRVPSSDSRKWESTMSGLLWGMIIGETIPTLIPKKWVENNQIINKRCMTDGKYDYGKTMGFSGIIGTATGAIIDLFKFIKRPSEKEYFEEIAALKQQVSGLSSQASTGDDPTTRMQDMVSNKRQEVASQKTR